MQFLQPWQFKIDYSSEWSHSLDKHLQSFSLSLDNRHLERSLSQELKYIEKLCCIAFSRVRETDRDRDRGHTDFIQSMKIYRDLLSGIPGYSRMHLNSGHLWFWNSASSEMVIILTTKQNTNPVLIEANRYSMNGHVWRATTASTTPCELFHPIQNHPESLDLRQT